VQLVFERVVYNVFLILLEDEVAFYASHFAEVS